MRWNIESNRLSACGCDCECVAPLYIMSNMCFLYPIRVWLICFLRQFVAELLASSFGYIAPCPCELSSLLKFQTTPFIQYITFVYYSVSSFILEYFMLAVAAASLCVFLLTCPEWRRSVIEVPWKALKSNCTSVDILSTIFDAFQIAYCYWVWSPPKSV